MFKKTLSLILVLVFVLLNVVSCADDTDPGADTTDASTTTNDQKDPTEVDIEAILADSKNRILVNEGASSYVIVAPAGDDDAKKVADDLAKGIQTLAGAELSVVDDSTAEAEYEILVGETNRAASKDVYAEVRQKDYKIASAEKKVVIAAMLRENLMLASKRLLGEMESATVDSKTYLWINAEYTYEKKVEYTLDKLTVADNDVKDYVIAYGDGTSDLGYAEAIQAMIIAACGHAPKLVKASETAEVELEILVGKTNRTASAATGDNTYEIKVSGNKLVFYYDDDASATKAWTEYEGKFNEAMGALAEDATAYELNALSVSGKIAAAAAGRVLYSENFDGKAASADKAAVATAIGWKQGYDRGWGSAAKLEITSSGTLKVDGGWTGFQVADASVFEDAYVYTIETDISFIGDKLGAFQIVFNSDRTYDQIVAANTMRGNCNLVSFRNAGSDNVFTTTNATNMPALTQLGYQLVHGTGELNATMVNNVKSASGSVEGTKQGVLEQGEFITDSSDNAMYNKKFRLAIEVDCIKGVVNMYIDGVKHATMTEGVLNTPGGVWLMAQNSLVEMDNIVIKTGTLDGSANVPDPAPAQS